jgi:F420-0:gamma-glutamyl ligase
MHVVYFFENRNLLLTQFRNEVPSEGEALMIKGRKGKVTSVSNIDEKSVHVQITLEPVNKNKAAAALDNTKKKKR